MKTQHIMIDRYHMKCVECGNDFYELEGKELSRCPSCGTTLFSESKARELTSDAILVVIDPLTGYVSLDQ